MSIAMKAPGRYVQGFGERKKLGQSVKKLGSTFYVLCSPGGRRRFGEEIEQSLTEQEKQLSLPNSTARRPRLRSSPIWMPARPRAAMP